MRLTKKRVQKRRIRRLMLTYFWWGKVDRVAGERVAKVTGDRVAMVFGWEVIRWQR